MCQCKRISMNFNCSRLLDEAFKNLWMEMFKHLDGLRAGRVEWVLRLASHGGNGSVPLHMQQAVTKSSAFITTCHLPLLLIHSWRSPVQTFHWRIAVLSMLWGHCVSQQLLSLSFSVWTEDYLQIP